MLSSVEYIGDAYVFFNSANYYDLLKVIVMGLTRPTSLAHPLFSSAGDKKARFGFIVQPAVLACSVLPVTSRGTSCFRKDASRTR